MKLKYILIPVVIYLFPQRLSAQFVRPISSSSMFYQLQSMEDGPWDFSPEAWYYSWHWKKIKVFGATLGRTKVPGLGVHDNGPAGIGSGGDRYVRKYAPSGKLRTQMLALVEISRKQNEAIASKYKEISDREVIDATDRQINLAIKVYESNFSSMYSNILSLCDVYDRFRQGGASQPFRDELNRIKSNISFIGSSYIRNAERSAAYLKELNNLKRLTTKLKIACKKSLSSRNLSNFRI